MSRLLFLCILALVAAFSGLQIAGENNTRVVAGVPIFNYQDRYYTAVEVDESTHEPVTDWVLMLKSVNISDTIMHRICHAQGKCLAIGDPSHGGVAFVVVQATDAELTSLLATHGSHVEFVEPDAAMQLIPDVDENSTASVLGKVASWGLDRADDRQGLDGTYTGAVSGGSGVHVYVADTGIRTTHQTFGGRAVPAVEVVGNDLVECGCDLDCAVDRHGHGTHCAGTIGGDEFGIARGVTLHAVKVLSDRGSGSWSGFVKALDWVATHGQRPAVLSASLGGRGRSAAVGKAVESATKAGVTVVVAAGNSRGDACDYSPAFAPSAITVGATDSSDNRAGFSNYGKCLDLFAPGVAITSAGVRDDTSEATMSGTSMACPHVSGAAALLLEVEPSATPSEIASKLQSQATNGVVKDPKGDSPNLLLYVDTSATPPAPSTTTTTTGACTTKTTTTTTTTTTTSTTSTTTTTTEPLVPASGFCGFEDSSQPYCGIWRQSSLGNTDWTQKSSGGAYGGKHYISLSCTEATIGADMKYVGKEPGRWGTSVKVKSNGMMQEFTFHPGYKGGAARAEPGFGNQNMGFTPDPFVFHHFELTFRKSGIHTFLIKDGKGSQQVWSKDFVRDGFFTGAVDGIQVLFGPSQEIVSPGQEYSFSMFGTHSMKLMAAPACKAAPNEMQGGEVAILDALTPPLELGAYLSFFYRVNGGNSEAALKVRVQSSTRGETKELWSTSRSQGDQSWTNSKILLDQFAGESVIVSFVGSQAASVEKDVIAIDDVMLAAGAQTGTTTSLPTTSLSSTSTTKSGTTTALSTTPSSSTSTTKAHEGLYYKMSKGSCCCPENERVLMLADCEEAHDTLGLERSFPWTGYHSGIPGGCSTRQGHSHNLHWNSEADFGRARSDLTPICKRSPATATTTTEATHTTTSMSSSAPHSTTTTTTSLAATRPVSTTTASVVEPSTTSAPVTTSSTTHTTTITTSVGSTSTTTKAETSTSTTSTATRSSRTSTPFPNGIKSGDTVFLQTRSGNGNHIDVEGSAVQARWTSQGNLQALVIEKEDGSNVMSGDRVYLKGHTGMHIEIEDQVVKARWNDQGGWQALVVEKRSGDGPILPGDSVCFKAHTGKHLDVEDGVVRARWNDCGDYQAMLIQKEESSAVFSGSPIHLLAHTGKFLDVEGGAVQARWAERGAWQTFVIENYGGRAIFSGDTVFLKAHTGMLVDVQDAGVQARWGDYGNWQKLVIERELGSGLIKPGDAVFLRAHTGNMVDVEGESVSSRWFDRGSWQRLVIEGASSRRLGQAMDATILV